MTNIIKRTCCSCHIEKTIDNFFKDKHKPLGIVYKCKECSGVKTIKKKCKGCNSPFETNKSLQVYCSWSCSPKSIKNYKEKKCSQCDIFFKPKSSLNKFCSPKCKQDNKVSRRSNKPITKSCKHCKSDFKPYTSLDKFCSVKCRVDSKKSKRSHNWSKESCENIKGTNNPAYRNGMYIAKKKKSSVGEREFINNSKVLKQKMKDDLGYVYCQDCKTSNSLRFETHHIVYRSEKPLHENLHKKRNLIVLCIRCHNEYHKKKSKRNQLVEDRKLNELFGEDVLNK